MTFPFDTSDPHEVASHLPELRAALAAKQVEREQVTEDIRRLEELILIGEGLSRRSGRSSVAKSERPRRRRASPAQDRAVDALEQASDALAGTAVGPTSLYKYMVDHGLDAPKDATVLGTNLWDAWRAGRVMRAPNGVYLPLDNTGRTEVDYPLTDYYYAVEQGLPGPARPARASAADSTRPASLAARSLPRSVNTGSDDRVGDQGIARACDAGRVECHDCSHSRGPSWTIDFMRLRSRGPSPDRPTAALAVPTSHPHPPVSGRAAVGDARNRRAHCRAR